jgi:hypothetical protein
MTASLYEAFGDNYETYPPNDNNQMKKRKKAGKKVSSYGREIPQNKYLSHEPQQNLNLTIEAADDNMDDQYLQIGNEFGPTDYNIKPKQVQEYVSQLSNIPQNFNPNNINDSTNYIIDQNSMNTVFKGQQQNQQNQQNKATNFDSDNDNDNESENESKQYIQQSTKKMNNDDPRMVDFNNKLDLILQKLGHFDEPAQENIHDIILFVIFGVFVIFILDSVYRVGKMTL